MSRFSVDSSQISQASAAVNTSAQRIQQEVAAMMRLLTELQNSWQGSAAAAFTDTVANWNRTQQQVETSLLSIKTTLQSTATSYQEVEAAAQRAFTRG